MTNLEIEKSSILTDRDMELLSAATSVIGQKRDILKKRNLKNKDTYYIERKNNIRYPMDIYEFDFQNARELAKLLDEMWTFQEKEDMKALIPNCVASTYKYFHAKKLAKNSTKISPFIYEF